MALADRDRAPERYELLERIAVGGMAEVFRARASGAHGFEKTIAIKRILPRLARSSEFVTRFIAEAKLAVQLTHANIVQVLDFGRTAEALYIAMEYVDGPDLATLRKAYAEMGERLPVAAAMHIALEMCKGLDFAHRRGVIHRDISPSNILLSMAGEVKIADFGIAKAVDSRSSLTMSRRIMGKWRYMSPEQTRGDRLDARSDIFSAGVVMQELFTGVPLFHGRNIEDIVQNIRAMPLPQPTVLRPELPEHLDAVLARVLQRDIDERYARASDLVQDLTEVCFAAKLVPTATHLGDAIGRSYRDLAPTDTGEPVPSAAHDADDIIMAELAQAGAGGASETESTRVTVQLEPQGGNGAPPPRPFPRRGATRTTFIRGSAGSDGLPVWERPTHQLAAQAQGAEAEAPDTPPQGKGRGGGARAPLPPEVPVAGRARSRRVAALLVLVLALAGAGAGALVLGSRSKDHENAGREPSSAGVPPRTSADAGAPDARRVTADAGRAAADAAEAASARLAVRTEPAGAEVTLDGEVLGKTPYDAEVPADGARHVLRLRKPGYTTAVVRVDLVPDEPVEIARTLERAVRYGAIDLYAEPWANVYFRGRKVAETPVKGLRLPVGRHKLRLVNPIQRRQTTIWVNVPGKKPYQVALP